MNQFKFGMVVGLILLAVSFMGAPAFANARPGAAAPDFKESDTRGKEHSLSDYRGKYVILEWHNRGCPYVKKHYNTGNMQKLQKELTAEGAVWLTVISSAEGKQGYMTAEEAGKYMKEKNAAQSAVLLDPDGNMGKAYGAKVTPHMYVISPEGKVLYNGAIDDRPTTDNEDVKGAKNYVLTAFHQAKKGEKVETSTTRPYGCGMKYAN